MRLELDSPPARTLKINTDGSSRGNPRHASIRGIGRDNEEDDVPLLYL